jgi:hypothetical protein
MAAKKSQRKRELIEPTPGDKRFVRRSKTGQFKDVVDVGRSLAADRRSKSKTSVKSGQGDKGDVKRSASPATRSAKKAAPARKAASKKAAPAKKAAAKKAAPARKAAPAKKAAAKKAPAKKAAAKKPASKKAAKKK